MVTVGEKHAVESNNVLEFVENNLENLNVIIDFCADVAKAKVSVDRFHGTSVLELATNVQKMY